MQNNALIVVDQKWLRSSHGLVAGVCDGLGRRLGVDPWLVRLCWLLSVCVFGTGLLAYLVLAFCLPRDDEPVQGQRRRLLGVCWRVSQRSGIEVGLVRTMAVVFSIVSLGLTVVGYFIMNFVLDDERDSLVI